MANNALTVKQNDTYPPVEAILKQTVAGQMLPIDLTAPPVKEVEFRMKKKTGGGAPITGKCIITPPGVNGEVVYNWKVGDTATIGEYLVEFKIIYTTPAGGIETVPNENYDTIKIEEDV